MGALKIAGQSAEPTVTSSDAGTLYYDSDTNKLRHYNGSAWADVSPAAGALTSADLPAGTILQVKSSNHNTQVSQSASTTFIATGVKNNITVSDAANDVLIMFTLQVRMYGNATANINTAIKLYYKDGGEADAELTSTSKLTIYHDVSGNLAGYFNFDQVPSMNYFHSNPGASTHYYEVYINAASGTLYVNPDNNWHSSMTLMEIKG